jgi:hypothetical protein
MSLLLLLHGAPVSELTDAATVYIDIQVISTEYTEYSDAATVYIDIQPGFIFLQVDFLLEIIGLAQRWTITQPVKSRWKIQNASRWAIKEIYKRWTILETRRFRWRS